MKKRTIIIKKTILLVLTVSFVLTALTGLTSLTACGPPKLTFENIVISSSIEAETKEPLDTITEFDINADHIYATVRFSGAKGSDNWRFKWTYLDSGEIVLDKGEQYNKEHMEQYFEGILESDIYPKNENSIIMPGNYKVEFYHNGELINTETFKVNKPQMEIIEVSLANQIDETYSPVNNTQKFNSTDTVYACVKVDYQIIGNFLKAVWKSDSGDILTETKTDLTIDYYSPSYVTFMFQWETGLIPEGNYKVEIYLNENLYGSFDFEVTGGNAVTFSKGNSYSNADFAFTMTFPDDWTYVENKTEGEVSLDISPPSADMPIVLLFKAVNPELYSPYKDFADRDSESFASQLNWTFSESIENNMVLKNGTPYKEYFYRYTDKDGNIWTMAYSFIENKDKLYLFIGIAPESSGEFAQAAYYGILDSLVFQ